MISGLESVSAPKAGKVKSARRESAPRRSCGVFTVLSCAPVIRTTPDCEYLDSLSLTAGHCTETNCRPNIIVKKSCSLTQPSNLIKL